MKDAATDLIRSLPDSEHIICLAAKLRQWLVVDLNRSNEPVPDFTESRARALLRAADLLDDPTRHSFERLMENETALRVALYDLLVKSELAENEEVPALVAGVAAAPDTESKLPVDWPGLAIAAFASKNGYELYQLDPASPPSPYSPAGQVLKRAAHYMREQVLRSATEREKLGRQLVYVAGRVPGLDNLPSGGVVAPLPPYYRTPIPVKYPEVSSQTIRVEPDAGSDAGAVSRGNPITITSDDLAPVREAPQTAPSYRAPIQVTGDEAGRARTSQVVTPNATVATGAEFSRAVRRKVRRSKGTLKATKLKVVVQEYADGPGLYGLQVRVRCKGIKSHVAGVTTREGEFVCELPVPEQSGLTYDVEVTWPRELGSEIERKSVTLHADRTQFTLPFYRRLNPGEKV